MNVKPFRFAVNVRNVDSWREWAQKARRLEALRYDMLNIPDHLADMPAPFPALVAAAAATKRLQIGTNVLNNDLRHPVLVAREAATVDLLSGGRLRLGLGAGSIQAEYEEAGLHFDHGSIRVARLAEAVAIIKGLLGGERLTFAGQYYSVRDHRIVPLPVQRPRPPLLIGGNGRQLLSLAAREADIVGLSGITFRGGGAAPPDLSGWRAAAVDERVALIRHVAGAEHFAQLEIEALLQRVIVTDDRRGAAAELVIRWPQLTVDEVLEAPYVLIGTVEQIVGNINARRERWGITSYSVQEPYMDAFAPVVAQLAGH